MTEPMFETESSADYYDASNDSDDNSSGFGIRGLYILPCVVFGAVIGALIVRSSRYLSGSDCSRCRRSTDNDALTCNNPKEDEKSLSSSSSVTIDDVVQNHVGFSAEVDP